MTDISHDGEALPPSERQAFEKWAVRNPPRGAIGRMLTAAMEQAVQNGANSVSMPDDYVEVAAWLAAVPEGDVAQAQTTRSQKLREAGFTRRPTGKTADGQMKMQPTKDVPREPTQAIGTET